MGFLILGILWVFIAGCGKEEDREPPTQTQELKSIDLYHGTITLGPREYFFVKFEAKDGDTLYYEARVKSGDGDISYAFWTDSANYYKWKNGQSAQLNGYVEAVPSVSYSPSLTSGIYYVIVGNSSYISSKSVWVRAYLRGWR